MLFLECGCFPCPWNLSSEAVSFEMQVGWSSHVIISPGAQLSEEARSSGPSVRLQFRVTGKHWSSASESQMGRILQEQMPEMESKTQMKSQSVNEDEKRALRQ